MKHTTRAYTKKNNGYWNSLSKKMPPVSQSPQNFDDIKAESFGGPMYVADASYERTNTNDSPRSSRIASKAARYEKIDKYSNLDRYSLPFTYSNSGNVACARDPIILCQKAYFHVGIFRNTVDLMAEFANDELYLEGGTDASRNLITKWMERISVEALKRQYFREYFRSGNVFLYRLFGEFTPDEIASLRKIYAAASVDLKNPSEGFTGNKLPLKYAMLNPADIYNYSGLDSGAVYKKILNPFEVQRLKNPQTEDEKRIFKSLTEEIRSKISSLGGGAISRDGIYVDLDAERLITSFYKKQDYEPFSIPFGFPVLEDINWKLELKKIDQAISRSVENMVLLVTAGAPPDKGGIVPTAMKALKDLFANEAMGRVIVADYTTNAEFVIPDIKKVIGKEKYEVVDNDIKEGLQNILFDDAKYQNTQIKTKVFFGKLKEARFSFLNDFFQEEVKKVCATVGFRDFPTVKFANSDITSQESIEKTCIRLLELGVITPEMSIEAIRQGKLPEASLVKEGQKEYVKVRKEGWYNPLIGSTPLYTPPEQNNTPTATIKAPVGRPSRASEEKVSKAAITTMAEKVSDFESRATSIMRKEKQIKRLSSEQKNIVSELCKSIVMACGESGWDDMFKKCAKGKVEINDLVPLPEINDISAENDLDMFAAALFYHAKEH